MTEPVTELLIIGGILTLFAWREYHHDQERKDLYNRLMSRDLTDYSQITSTRPPPKSRNFVKRGLKKFYDNQKSGDE